jgi:hypothetical protein
MKSSKPNTANARVLQWVDEMTKLCQPDQVFWCDGSAAEKEALTAEAVAQRVLIKLNQQKLPGCYYHRSDPRDVSRSEDRTFICTESADEAGPTNNWVAPAEMYGKLRALCAGGHEGAHDVRGSLLDGAARLAIEQGGDRVDRFHLRGVEHENRHAHGSGGLRSSGGGRGFQPRAALHVGPGSAKSLHCAFPARQRHHLDRIQLRRQCIAGQEMSLLAHRLLARKRRAGWPSTC